MNQLSIAITRVTVGLLLVLGSYSRAESTNTVSAETNKLTFRLASSWPGFSRGTVSGAKIVGNYAYVSVGEKLVVYEITPSGDLIERGSVKPSVSHSLLGIFYYVWQNNIYVDTFDRLYIYDISKGVKP